MLKMKTAYFIIISSIACVCYFNCSADVDFSENNASNYVEVNNEIFGYEIIDGDVVIQGDIIIAKEDEGEDAIINAIKSLYFNEQGTKAVDPDLNRRWPDGIVYYIFNKNYPKTERKYVLNAMKWWSDVSRIRFKEGFGMVEPFSGSMYFVEFKKSSVNSSYIGMIGGCQTIRIASLWSEGVIAHEIGHTLGLKHIHQRKDRDTHITVNRENSYVSDSKWKTNFGKLSSDYTWGETYDFDSIMHYGWSDFGKDCNVGDPECYESIYDQSNPALPVHYLQPCFYGNYCYKMVISVSGDDPSLSKTAKLGQRDYLSTIDIEKIRVMYGYAADTGTWNNAGDSNNDNMTDLYFWRKDTGDIIIAQTDATGNLALLDAGNAWNWIVDDPNTWRFSGDFNGDGRMDMGFWNGGDGNIWLGLSDGSRINWILGGNAWPFIPGDQLTWKFTGDFNGDGKTDLGFWHEGDGNIWLGLSNGNRIEFHLAYSNPSLKHIPYDANTWRFVGDLNGDGKTDIGYWGSSENIYQYIVPVFFGLSDGNRINFRQVLTSTEWAFVPSEAKTWRFTGDFNGDGKMDLGFWRSGDGMIYCASSNNKILSFYDMTSGTYAPFKVSGWNILPSDINTWRFTGDFDGDNKTDIGVWHGGSGEIWYIQSSFNYSMFIKAYSNKLWKPLPSDYSTWKFTGDFNRDGKTDIGFWNRNNGDIYYGFSGKNIINFQLMGNYK